MTELLNIYSPNKQYKGTMPRLDVHKNSEWHQTFQCIFIFEDCILFQERSKSLVDYPGLLDVTVGGHIKADENMSAGVREIKEEMGLDLQFNRLNFLCTIPESIIDKFNDNEFINIFTVEISKEELNSIHFNDGEVNELYKIKLSDFIYFSNNLTENVKGVGLYKKQNKIFSLKSFLPYSSAYFICISSLMKRNFEKNN
ncbi:NUDIX hydrolase [Staphylococcus delphini]|uniref:NUDIX hydrolase n=1 Tax=Staphylococcus delphini TaxID=53344 RepID=UPI0012D2E612|nr:NUDIX domain-containing protein [Staphylococcus delphini]MTV21115.1 NUDIX domain-containing protein [Staphylococcus delphini]